MTASMLFNGLTTYVIIDSRLWEVLLVTGHSFTEYHMETMNVPGHQPADTSSSWSTSQADSNLQENLLQQWPDRRRLVPLSSRVQGSIWVEEQSGQAMVTSTKVHRDYKIFNLCSVNRIEEEIVEWWRAFEVTVPKKHHSTWTDTATGSATIWWCNWHLEQELSGDTQP